MWRAAQGSNSLDLTAQCIEAGAASAGRHLITAMTSIQTAFENKKSLPRGHCPDQHALAQRLMRIARRQCSSRRVPSPSSALELGWRAGVGGGVVQ